MDPQAELMLRKAGEDRAALEFALPDAVFGFHAQQSFEKLFKAMIAASGAPYERTHDLTELLKEISTLGAGPLTLTYNVRLLQPYAVLFRYDDVDPLPESERQKIRDAIDLLTQHVQQMGRSIAP